MTTRLTTEGAYQLRHIHPTTRYPSEGADTTVLGTAYGFTWLPVTQVPVDSGVVEGTYSYRLDDAGEASVTFPNVAGPGTIGLWRERFSTEGAAEFLEIHRDARIEFVMCISRVDIDRGQVTLSGPDASSLLRRAYERDRTWTAAPRDVVEAYTQVPVARLADDFDGSSLTGWTAPSYSGITPTTLVSDSRVKITSSNVGSNSRPWIEYDLGASLGDTWRLTVVGYALGDTATAFRVAVGSIAGNAQLPDVCEVRMTNQPRPWNPYGGSVTTFSIDRAGWAPTPLTVEITRQGRWIFYTSGGFLWSVEAADSSWTNLRYVKIGGAEFGSNAYYAWFDSARLIENTDFLTRGTDVGDYVLPGDYPTGGLHGRYYDDSDLEGLTSAARKARILAPDREARLLGDRLDASMNTASGLTIPPSGSGDFFSVRWSGAVYLRGDLGNYTIETTSVDDGNRLWIGKTGWGDQLIDDWNPGAGTNTATWTAADYGAEAGWYPIVVEYFEDGGGQSFRLQFTPPGTGYTDPGGTAIAASTKITIPSTSLSPLGCYDNRAQGQSHFDLAYGVARDFGYQMTCEPMSLESGEFPGRLVPRVHVGRNTDVVLTVDEDDAGEPLFSPGVTYDSSDQTTTVIGSAAGLAESKGAQVRAEVTDHAATTSSLFALETFVDAGDISFTDLLHARLQAELALRGSPWEETRGTPHGQERLADTYPLTGALAAMRWRPGDGIRIRIPDIGVEDTDTRQLTQVSRSFVPHGRTGTQVAWRQRPRSATESLRRLTRAALVKGRAYQGQVVTLVGKYEESSAVAAGAYTGGYSIVPLLTSDRVLRAVLRITVNSAGQALNAEINGSDRTTGLGGPWTTIPVDIEATAYATQASTTDHRMFARIQNGGGSPTSIQFQLVVEVLR